MVALIDLCRTSPQLVGVAVHFIRATHTVILVMKCHGRPEDGRCPDNRNDDTVHNTIGDIFLCCACEEYRWPTIASNVKAAKAASSNKNTKPTTTSTVIGNKTAKQPDRANRRRGAQTVKMSVSSDDSCDTICSQCLLTVVDNGDTRVIRCDTCQSLLHQHCTNMSAKVFDIFIKIKVDVGWVCESCQELLRAQGKNLQSAMVTLSEEVAVVKCELTDVKEQLRTVMSPNVACSTTLEATAYSTQHSRSFATPDQIPMPSSQTISQTVYRTLRDVNRRKQNVVVSGLSETTGTDDRAEFIKLCETYLSSKPYVIKCERIGRIVDARPRRLLVRLSSESAAAELLRSARTLRRASDSSVTNIYINPDLSPMEAKLAFEARQRRREHVARSRLIAVSAAAPDTVADVHGDAADDAIFVPLPDMTFSTSTNTTVSAAVASVNTDSTAAIDESSDTAVKVPVAVSIPTCALPDTKAMMSTTNTPFLAQ